MSTLAERQKSELIERLARQAGAGVAADPGSDAFLRAFFANVPPDDLLREDPADLLGAALALWRFGRERDAGRPQIRLYDPKPGPDGWSSTHSVVEIINDDMPFLVDSVGMALNRLGFTVHLVIHPILRVARDGAGRIQPPGAAGAAAESWMQVRLDQRVPEQQAAEAVAGIAAALADVRLATQDWKAMLAQVERVIAELDTTPPPLPPEDIAEAVAFLGWLTRDNFTFLGYREYERAGPGEPPAVRIRPEAGLGLLRDEGRTVFGLRHYDQLPEETRLFMEQARLLMVTRSNVVSTVHRPAHLDAIGIKRLDAGGRFLGERLFVGLFTSPVYLRSPSTIPLLRRKVANALARAGFAPSSHDDKALQHIFETYPREELFEVSEDELLDTALGILHLQDRQRVALFVRRDPFERFVSCLVYVPRDRYSAALRERIQAILAEAFAGRVDAFYTRLDDAVLARVQIIVATTPGAIPEVDLAALEQRVVEAARSWTDRLQDALIAARGEADGLAAMRRYGRGFPTGYQEQFDAATAVFDIGRLDDAVTEGGIALELYRGREAPASALRLKLYNASGAPIALSDVLPVLENVGLKVVSEMPYAMAGADGRAWIHDFDMVTEHGEAVDLGRAKAPFHKLVRRVLAGEMEDDGFNRLVLRAGLDWREIALLRACARHLRQLGAMWSQAYMEETLARHAGIARLLVDVFVARFEPAQPGSKGAEAAALRARGLIVEIEHALDAVSVLDEDRIIRRFLNLIGAAVRTNYFQPRDDGRPKPYLAIKLDSRAVEGMPLPRPLYEIFVYSPRVEAVHLRGGKVARGGIRWSDRREDFRTEVLGLMKAQMVKNAVIVPVGSKGGFIVKRPPPGGDREAVMTEVVACYRTMMRGLLDVTDNIVGDAIVPPAAVVRHDDDDPYLVVAADKGTATFSDIANGISVERGFWLGDAFASGGSAGYDHKKMGITARGAWEAVKRHFRELGRDTQAQDFTAVGIGDMGGDVFGNGMLQSPHMRLIGAFNHLHIFIDPDPDPAASFAERKRLFAAPRSGWNEYDAKLISAGGGVFERKAKSIRLTPEIRRCLDTAAETLTPAELIQALLKAPVDLLYLGGIGTYVKASDESSAEVGDRANDALRIDARALRCRVVAEGANLGFTQRARVEAAQKGVRLNTDAVDNSAGVDCSDHEVNIKILLNDPLGAGALTMEARNALLAGMTQEVAALVLRDNYLQTQAISVAEAQGWLQVDQQRRFMRALEKAGALDRALEALPDDETIDRRHAARQGLTRPELAVLLAYAKMTLYAELLPSDLPDDPELRDDLAGYFPSLLRERFPEAIARHRLRREIIATVVTNDLVNRVGPTFVNVMKERTALAAAPVARAYLITRTAFALPPLWDAIEALDGKVPADVQTAMLLEIARAAETATLWFLRHGTAGLDIAGNLARFADGIAGLSGTLWNVAGEDDRAQIAARAKAFGDAGVPAPLAESVARLREVADDLDIVRVAIAAGRRVETVARLDYRVGDRFGLDWLRDAAAKLPMTTHWERLANAAVLDDLDAHQTELTQRLLTTASEGTGEDAIIDAWIGERSSEMQRLSAMLDDLRQSTVIDLARMAVANHQFRTLLGS